MGGADLGALAPYVPEQWTPTMRAALDEWAFGCLVPLPPLMWAQAADLDHVVGVDMRTDAAVTDHDRGPEFDTGTATADIQTVEVAGTAETADASGTAEVVEPVEDERVPCRPDPAANTPLVVAEADWVPWDGGEAVCGVVTTQTCDVGARRPGDRHPTVQVAPVVRVDNLNPQLRESLQRWDVVDRALLDPEGWPDTYIADLRISLPLSKAVLTKHVPVPAYPDETRMLQFAEHVAAKTRRPALHDFLSEDVREEIRAAIKASTDDASWWGPVEEVLVLATPTRLEPNHAQLVVVAQTPLAPADRQQWHDLTDRLVRRARKNGITLRPPMHQTADQLRASVYRSAVKLHLPELRSPTY